MKKVTFTIEMENAAFEDNEAHEVARILDNLAKRIEYLGDMDYLNGKVIRDLSGNTVGRIVVNG